MTQQNIKGATTKPTESSAKKRAPRTRKTEVESALEQATLALHGQEKLVRSPEQARKKAHTPDGIRQLADNIAAVGLLQNLVGHVMADGQIGIAAGDGRRQAIALLVSEGRWPADRDVPVLIIPEALAKAVSLSENGKRLDMHPVDQISGFSDLAKDGKTPAQIAGLLGYSTRHVERCLTLAGLAPFLLELLAADKITLDHCQVMTLAADHGRQEQVWQAALGYARDDVPHVSTLRHLMTDGETEIAGNKAFAFVGRDAYIAAGGVITTDLFTADGEGLADRALISALQLEKLQAVAATLAEAEGWEWSAGRMDRINHYGDDERLYRLAKAPELELNAVQLARATDIEAALPGATDADKAQLQGEYKAIMEAAQVSAWRSVPRENRGVVVSWAGGEPLVQRGVYRITEEEHAARAAREKAKADQNKQENPVEAIPATLVKELSCDRSMAVQAALCTQADVSVSLLTWHLCCSVFSTGSRGNSPLHVSLNDQQWAVRSGSQAGGETKAYQFLIEQKALWEERLPEGWKNGFSWLLAWSAEDRASLLGFVSAMSVSCVQTRIYGKTDRSSLEEVEGAVNFRLSEWWRPTAANYFGRVNKEQIATDLQLAGLEDLAREAAKMKKGEAAKAAEHGVSGLEWTPDWMVSQPPVRAAADAVAFEEQPDGAQVC